MKMKKTSLNTTKVTDRKIKRLYLVAATVVAAAFVMAMPAFADDPLTTINNLSDFVFSAIKAIGAILLGFGIVQIGLALKGHDASQRAQGFMTFATPIRGTICSCWRLPTCRRIGSGRRMSAAASGRIFSISGMRSTLWAAGDCTSGRRRRCCCGCTCIRFPIWELWENVVAMDLPDLVVRTEAAGTAPKQSLLGRLLRPDHVNVAFVHQRTVEASPWTCAHDVGRKHLEDALGSAITVRSYFGADTAVQAEALLEQAVADGSSAVVEVVNA